MASKHGWLLKRTPRSVDALKLWSQNPRLNPEEDYATVSDFAIEVTTEEADKNEFLNLVKSIARRGFIPADPIVVWQETDNKFYVAEGNRRVLALKLLRKPTLAPKSIRSLILKLLKEPTTSVPQRIHVCVAPSFEDAEWYISQRNSVSSLQRRWTAEQQRRWVMKLYDKYKGEIRLIRERVDLSEAELQKHIRILKLKGRVTQLAHLLSAEEYAQAISFRFPITTFERFFNSTQVRTEWGIDFSGYDVRIRAEKESFNNAFATAIKRMLLEKGNANRIDSRKAGDKDMLGPIVESLPKVNTLGHTEVQEEDSVAEPYQSEAESAIEETSVAKAAKPPKAKDDPTRPRLIDSSYVIRTDEYRMVGLFSEMQTVPVRYKNSVAASVRIFLDLVVLKYIKENNLEAAITTKYKVALRDVTLKKRLEHIKTVLPTGKCKLPRSSANDYWR